LLGFTFFEDVVEGVRALEDGGAEEAVGFVPGLALGFVEGVIEEGRKPFPAVDGFAIEPEAAGDRGIGEALEEKVDGLLLLWGKRFAFGGWRGGLVLGKVFGIGRGGDGFGGLDKEKAWKSGTL